MRTAPSKGELLEYMVDTENRFFLTFRLAASSGSFPSDEAARRNVRKKTIFSDKKQNSIGIYGRQ